MRHLKHRELYANYIHSVILNIRDFKALMSYLSFLLVHFYIYQYFILMDDWLHFHVINNLAHMYDGYTLAKNRLYHK
jgi:hypothetical protein